MTVNQLELVLKSVIRATKIGRCFNRVVPNVLQWWLTPAHGQLTAFIDLKQS